MKYRIKILLLAVVHSLFLYACTDDIGDSGDASEQDATISIATRGPLYDTEPDDRISSLRIMAFDLETQRIKSNVYYDATVLSSTINYNIKTGTYTFVMIANEPDPSGSDGVHSALNNIVSYEGLASLQIPMSYFSTSRDIPMVYVEPKVAVLTGNQVSVNGGASQSIWRITTFERLAVKFDLLFLSTQDITSTFTGIRFENVPDKVPLLKENANYSGPRTKTLEINKSQLSEASASEKGSYAWGMKLDRVVLPSNMFTPATAEDKAMKLSVVRNGGYSNSVLLGIGQTDNTLPRNHYFLFTGRINNSFEANIEAAPWGSSLDIDGDNHNRVLNITSTELDVNILNSARIFFYTNQTDVQVESTCSKDGTGGYSVNGEFDDLSGYQATNRYFNPTTGTGWIQINTIKKENAVYRIVLNAGGLRKEIKINVSVPPIPPFPWVENPYVGTFHRHDQKGERVIIGETNQPWTAEVEDPNGSGDFVLLSKTRSADPKFGTKRPGDAENYPVTIREGVKYIEGGPGVIIFRIGLTSYYAADKVRYARVKITSGSEVSYIYVRQGEAADYLFSPTETVRVGGVDKPRTLAKKIPVYNLTVPDSYVGQYQVSLGTNGGVWTKYPTQSGYLFLWFDRTAFKPGDPVTPTSWPADNYPHSLAWNTTWETCPPGYRRPSNNTLAITHAEYNHNRMDYSELGHSLYLTDPFDESTNPNPVITVGLTNQYTKNNIWGYYADGYFDRIERPDNFTVGTGPEVACRGRVIFNPSNNHSVFFPSTGRRMTGDGKYVLPGISGNYWTSSHQNNETYKLAVFLSVNAPGEGSTVNGIIVFSQFAGRNAGHAIRCVAID